MTFGIKPIKYETGYGYIEADGENVKSFREKPNRDTVVFFMIQEGFFGIPEFSALRPECFFQNCRSMNRKFSILLKRPGKRLRMGIYTWKIWKKYTNYHRFIFWDERCGNL